MNVAEFPEIDRLCQTYGYPADIQSLLKQVAASVLIRGTRSIVLSGSGSRGELTYSPAPSGVRLFSDLELAVVADPVIPDQVAHARSRIGELEKRQWRADVRTFHIDIVFSTLQAWKRKQDSFQAWETRERGWILFGEDIRRLIDVEINPRTSIQSSLNRLWHLLLYFPERLITGNPTEWDLQVFNYVLHRAALDFPLWLLVPEGILVAGFAGRYEYLEQNRDHFIQKEFPIDALIELVSSATQARKNLELNQEIVGHYDSLLQWYLRMLRWSLRRGNVEAAALPAILQQHGREIYPSRNWRRYLWESKMAVEIAKVVSLKRALAWLRQTKQVQMTTFLWHMNQAASQFMLGDTEAADRSLRRASSTMVALWPARRLPSENRPFSDSWLELRRRFFGFVMLFYRGLEQNRSYYQFLLNSELTSNAA